MKTLDEKIAALVAAAQSAADWMLEAPQGTDQHERGEELKKAVDDIIR